MSMNGVSLNLSTSSSSHEIRRHPEIQEETVVKRTRSLNSFIDAVAGALGLWGPPPPAPSAGGDVNNNQDQVPSTSSSTNAAPPAREALAHRLSQGTIPNTPGTRVGVGRYFEGLFWKPIPPPNPDINGNNPAGGDPEDERRDPSITFASCGGLEEQIAYIQKHVIMILKNRTQFEKWGVDPVKGIIFHGPPGSGKTLLAKALANELKAPDGRPFKFYMRNGSELYVKWVGDTEAKIRELFDTAKKNAPAIIFLDELDGICGNRESASGNLKSFHVGVVTQLLACMDQVVRGQVIVIGATNRLDAIDPAFRRPGRFDKVLAFHLPNAVGRVTILRIHTRNWLHKPSGADYDAVAAATVGFTGADLEQLCRETFVHAFERQFPEPGNSLDLSTLRICLEDWKSSLQTQTRTNSNVFGLAHYTGELATPEIRLLTSGIERDLGGKIIPWLAAITRQEKGTAVNAFLVWSRHRRTVDTFNSYVIPSVVSTIDPNEIVAYRMDITDIANPAAIYQFMAKVMDTNKTKLLIIPHLDDLMDMACHSSIWLPFTTELTRLRGTKILLLATACADVHDIRSDAIQSLLSTAESLEIRKLTTAEAKSYLEGVFSTDYYRQTQQAHNPTQRDACNPAVLARLGKNLGPVLASATDFAVRHQISDALDLKAKLKRSVDCKLTPSQHVLKLKTTLSKFKVSTKPNPMYV